MRSSSKGPSRRSDGHVLTRHLPATAQCRLPASAQRRLRRWRTGRRLAGVGRSGGRSRARRPAQHGRALPATAYIGARYSDLRVRRPVAQTVERHFENVVDLLRLHGRDLRDPPDHLDDLGQVRVASHDAGLLRTLQ